MKKIRIDITDLIAVLETLKESGGTKEVIFFDHDGSPALADADDPENLILFQQAEDEDPETDEMVH